MPTCLRASPNPDAGAGKSANFQRRNAQMPLFVDAIFGADVLHSRPRTRAKPDLTR
jgi:hypothetical protein